MAETGASEGESGRVLVDGEVAGDGKAGEEMSCVTAGADGEIEEEGDGAGKGGEVGENWEKKNWSVGGWYC